MCVVPLSSMEIVKIVLTASLSLTSMLVAIIGFLLAQYGAFRSGPSYSWRPYRNLAVVMVFVLLIGGLNCLICLLYLINAFSYEIRFQAFNIILGLFVTLVLAIMLGTAYVAAKILR